MTDHLAAGVTRRAFLLAGGAALAGCGGGGASTGTPPPTGSVPPVITPPPTPTPPPVPPTIAAWPTSADPVLAQLQAIWGYRGDFVPGPTYRPGEMVSAEGRLWFCFATARSIGRPADDRLHFRELPLLAAAEAVIVDDQFTDRPGAVAQRVAGGGYRWEAGGAGNAAARVQDGYMSSADNTYFCLGSFTERVVEWSCWSSSSAPAPVFTMSTSSRGVSSLFSDMYHVNWQTRVLGDASMWDSRDSSAGKRTALLYGWPRASGVNDVALQPGTTYKLTLRFRGAFLFGYVDDRLAFVHLTDDLLWFTDRVRSFYIQNHVATFGVERHYRVQVKAA